jgi:hypothetical protein
MEKFLEFGRNSVLENTRRNLKKKLKEKSKAIDNQKVGVTLKGGVTPKATPNNDNVSAYIKCCAATKCCIPEVKKCILVDGVTMDAEGNLVVNPEAECDATHTTDPLPLDGGQVKAYYRVCVDEDNKNCTVCYMAELVVKNDSGGNLLDINIRVSSEQLGCDVLALTPALIVNGDTVQFLLSMCCDKIIPDLDSITLNIRFIYKTDPEGSDKTININVVITLDDCDCASCGATYTLSDTQDGQPVVMDDVWHLNPPSNVYLHTGLHSLEGVEVAVGQGVTDCYIYTVTYDIPSVQMEDPTRITNTVMLILNQSGNEAVVDSDSSQYCIQTCEPTGDLDVKVNCNNDFCFCTTSDVTQLPPNNCCDTNTKSQGFYKTHCEAISSILNNPHPIDPNATIAWVNTINHTLSIGTVNYYAANILCAILNCPLPGNPNNNSLYKLAKQLITVKLNILNGGITTPALLASIASADSLIGSTLISGICNTPDFPTAAQIKVANDLQDALNTFIKANDCAEVGCCPSAKVDYTVALCNSTSQNQVCFNAISHLPCLPTGDGCDINYTLHVYAYGSAPEDVTCQQVRDEGQGLEIGGPCVDDVLGDKCIPETCDGVPKTGWLYAIVTYNKLVYDPLFNTCEASEDTTPACTIVDSVDVETAIVDANCDTCTFCAYITSKLTPVLAGCGVLTADISADPSDLLRTLLGLPLNANPPSLSGPFNPPQTGNPLQPVCVPLTLADFPLSFSIIVPSCGDDGASGTLSTVFNVVATCDSELPITYSAGISNAVTINPCSVGDSAPQTPPKPPVQFRAPQIAQRPNRCTNCKGKPQNFGTTIYKNMTPVQKLATQMRIASNGKNVAPKFRAVPKLWIAPKTAPKVQASPSLPRVAPSVQRVAPKVVPKVTPKVTPKVQSAVSSANPVSPKAAGCGCNKNAAAAKK